MVLDALHDGWLPRWIPNHQAGYPAEFYPLGADIVVAVAWLLGLGFVPLEVIHKLVVIGVLFIPVAAYLAITRRDGSPASVAFVAALLHLFLPGSWLAGGPNELLWMGLWPNVFATYLTLPLMIWAGDYLRRGRRSGLVLAAGVASLAIYSNPRSLIAVGTVLLAVGLVTVFSAENAVHRPTRIAGQVRWVRPRNADRSRSVLIGRSAALVAVIGLLSAALIVPLRAHQDLYDFAHFVEFGSLRQVWTFYSGAIPIAVIVLAAIGMAIGLRQPGLQTRTLAVWLPLAILVIVVAGWVLRDLSIFAQLEGPRLLPVLRPPTIFLAALAIHWLAGWLLRIVRLGPGEAATGIVAAAMTMLVVLTPVSPLASAQRGLPDIETTNDPRYVEIVRSVRLAEVEAGADDRLLIVGSPLSIHASFWIPALTHADVYHSDWIWHWRPPAIADRTQIADLDALLDLSFLHRNALTLVLVATNDTDSLVLARAKPYLRQVAPRTSGAYAIFRVDDGGTMVRGPVSVARGEVRRVDIARQRLVADLVVPQPTEVRVAINDYPAWRATVNGRTAPIRRSDLGYMLIDVPAGDVRLELTYEVEPAVWAGRAMVVLGVFLLAGVIGAPAGLRRWRRSAKIVPQ